MIHEEATKEAFGYYASKLKPRSNKQILATCAFCGEIIVTTKNHYHTFCHSCSTILGGKMKGKTLTEETKAKLSAAKKGEKNHNYGKPRTKETRALISKNHADFQGKKHPGYKGGKKLTQARSDARRKELGYTLLLPLGKGEVGHHVTNEYIVGMSAEVHNSIGGRRKKHRIRVLEWLKANDTKKYEIALNVLR